MNGQRFRLSNAGNLCHDQIRELSFFSSLGGGGGGGG